jgi:site-specific recombinase XerD
MYPLRAQMIEQLQLHRKAPGTQDLYVKAIYGLTAHYKRSPDQLSPQEIQRYLHHLLTKRQLAWSTCNVVAAAIRFFYVDTLGWTPVELNLPPRPAQKYLPRVLSVEQLECLFTTTLNPKHRALLMTVYAAGLRVSEVVRLQLQDIESDPSRMLIRGSGSRAGLLLPSPLRTARTTFTVSRSSLSNALLRNAVMPGGRPSQYALGASAPSGVPHTNQWWCARHLRVWRVHQWVDPLSSAFSPKEVGQALL